MEQVKKGTIASISENTARVVPSDIGTKATALIIIPRHLRGDSGNLKKGTEVVYTEFEDATGLLLGRADGEWGSEFSGGGDASNGATFTPTVSEEGVLSWTNDKELENPKPVNIKGDTGATGPQGPQGEKGEKGDTGATGPQGPPTTVNGKNGDSITLTASDVGAVSAKDGYFKTIGLGNDGDGFYVAITCSDGNVYKLPTDTFLKQMFLALTGGTISGDLTVTGNTVIDQINNEPGNTNHCIVFGKSSRDKVEIFEYGGTLNLWKSVNGTNTLILGVSPSELTYNGNTLIENGNLYEGGTLLSDKYLKRGSYERIQGTSDAHKNLNDYTLPGFYNVKTTYTDNCPSGIGIDAVLLVYPWNSSGYEMQEITETAASGSVRRWVRKNSAGTWTAWKAILSEDNYSLYPYNYLVSLANPITSTANDTPSIWAGQNCKVAWYTKAGQLVDQPSQYGFLFNMTDGAGDTHQLFAVQSGGDIYHRGGNYSGWKSSWRKILDSSNFESYVQSIIDKLVSTGTITFNSAVTATGKTVLQKFGHIVCLNTVVTVPITANGWTAIGTLPSGFRPSVNITHPITTSVGTDHVNAFIDILTDGTMRIYQYGSTAGTWANINVTFYAP